MRRPMGSFIVPGAWLRGAAVAVIAGAVVAACSSSGSGASGAGQSVSAATTAPSAEASSGASGPAMPSEPNATGVPTTLDPCQLVTAQEASQLAGVTFGAGKEDTTQGYGKICTYGSATGNDFNVIVGQAPDVATAQAAEAEAEAQIKEQAPVGVTTTQISGLGDAAVFLSISESVGGQTINGSAIYVLKGTVFFGLADLAFGKPAPSQAALTTQAQLVLSRVP
jgi:hypothetical protein